MFMVHFQLLKNAESKKLKVVGYEKNHGKGYAVRYGMARAKGDLISFIDSGMDINPNGLSMLLEHMIWYDSDAIVGSIRHSASKVIGYPFKRKIYSIIVHLIMFLQPIVVRNFMFYSKYTYYIKHKMSNKQLLTRKQ